MTYLSYFKGYKGKLLNLKKKRKTTFNPRSSSVLSSTDAEITPHRASMFDKYPRKIGAPAVKASLINWLLSKLYIFL